MIVLKIDCQVKISEDFLGILLLISMGTNSHDYKRINNMSESTLFRDTNSLTLPPVLSLMRRPDSECFENVEYLCERFTD
jgi:hypothetical protein